MPDEAKPAVVQPRLSSAVMLLRNLPSGQGIEVFMVRRVIQSDFMPDVYVFPGGSVSADDQAAELAQDVSMPVAPSAADPEGRTILGSGVRAAAIRELFEEAGVLARCEQGTFPLVFATIHQLRDLATFSSVKETLESTTTRHVVTHMPILVRENGVTSVYLPEDAANPWNVPEHMT